MLLINPGKADFRLIKKLMTGVIHLLPMTIVFLVNNMPELKKIGIRCQLV